jgi:YVTN family beta-propeller protein
MRLCALFAAVVGLFLFPSPFHGQQSAPAAVQRGVVATLPNGREIRPIGGWIPVAPYPFAIALKTDGSEAAIPSIGFPFALNIITHPDLATAAVRRMPPSQPNDPNIEVHAGLAYSPDGKLLYVATGNSGKVALYNTSDWSKTAEIPLDGPSRTESGSMDYANSFAASLLLSADGKTLYALDQGNFRIAMIDVSTAGAGKVIASIATGAYPFGMALSPDGARLYVTNIGIFEYSTIPGAKHNEQLSTGLHFAPFGFPSKEAREGTVAEGRTIPALGDENSVIGSSLWTYDVRDASQPRVTAKLHLGERIAGPQVGGSAPTGVVAGADAVYVSLAHQDTVAKVSPDGAAVLGIAPLSPFTGSKFQDAHGRPLRGVMPSGLALRGNQLFVAESGIDAVAILNAETMQVLGHIPVGWNPTAVAVSPDGKTLYVVNTKGKGTGPNGGRLHDPDAPTYVGALELGSLSVIPLTDLKDAQPLTAQVVANNTHAIDHRPQLPRLKHCFLVIRENRTYDEVLGDLPNTNGDPLLARYGLDGWAQERSETRPEASHLNVTPNLHALAHRFAISDNYFVDSDVSVDGHRWVVGINPTTFMNTAWTSGYGGRRKSDFAAAQPGRRALFGGSDSPMPEDEPQFGTLWEHVAGSGLGILNYGESIEVEGADEMDGSAPEGQRLFLNAPLLKPVFEHSDRRYPTFNLGIPDQYRVEEFKRDFSLRLAQGRIPALIVIRLPNDHTADPRPQDGYPYRASYVADNDLALGRIVDYLSKTSIWKDSAMLITEDDAQAGVDHVDAHRSILAVLSPWVTPGSVSHQHSSMGSITRTMDELLGLGPLNLEDALAGELDGIFASAPHLEPYNVLASDGKVFNPAKARLARPKTKLEAAALLDMDDAPKIQKEMDR